VNGVPQYGVAGGPGFDAETANVFEVGYRAQPATTLSYSTTLFFSRYDRLRTLEPNPSGPGSVFENLADGLTRGIEAWATWQVADAWRLSGGGVVQRVGTTLHPLSRDLTGTTGLFTSDPAHYWQVRSSFDLPAGQEFDVTVRHVGALPQPAVPAYTAVDARWGWRIRPGVELSVIAHNLCDPRHAEFGAPDTRSEYGRTFAVRVVWTP
jgi:iron complex outermembrane receptor protein